MELQDQAELSKIVIDWLRSKGLCKKGEIVIFIISTSSVAPIAINPADVEKRDEEALQNVIARMGDHRTRLVNCLTNMNIIRLSQVIARDSANQWHISCLGSKTLRAFAQALAAEDIECFVTRNFLNPAKTPSQIEFEKCTVQPLGDKDWEKIMGIHWDIDKQPAILMLRNSNNKPVELMKALKPTRRGSPPANIVHDINLCFKRYKLPYRIKIGEIPKFGTAMKRPIQLVVMSS